MSQDPARNAVSRGEWQQAYDLLVEADARSPLGAPDHAGDRGERKGPVMSDALGGRPPAADGRSIRRIPRVLAMLVAFAALAGSARNAYAQKANGEVCFLPSECASGRCVVTCQAQVRTDTVAANASTVCFAGPQRCELPTDGSLLRDEYFMSQIPPKFLDIAPPSTQEYAARSAPAPPGPASPDGSSCILPGDCDSHRCLFFKCKPQSPPMPKKPDGAGCFLPDECTSGRCDLFSCKAQPAKKADGASCFLPGECASGSCNLFKCRAPAACEAPEPARPAPAVLRPTTSMRCGRPSA